MMDRRTLTKVKIKKLFEIYLEVNKEIRNNFQIGSNYLNSAGISNLLGTGNATLILPNHNYLCLNKDKSFLMSLK